MNVKEIIDNPTVYKIQEFDPIIKFRSLNRDHNFIFISNKNSIQVLEPIKLIHIYSFHHNETIIDFVVSPKDSSLILCSSSSIEIYQLICAKLSDYHLKIKYELKKSLPIENICNLSVSTIGDVIACISRHRGIKLFDNNLNLIKTLNFQVEFLPHESSMFPLDVFQITYDTKNIILSKYNTDKICLSGGVMKSSRLFLEALEKKSNELISRFPLKPIKIVLAQFDQDAGLMGGVSVALHIK